MNKELYKTEIEKEVKNFEIIEQESVLIDFQDELIKISTYHSQDCCESVYGDFSPLEYIKEKIKGKKIKEIIIKGVEGMGFLLIFTIDYRDEYKVFIPCYNYQNGYYSSNLELSFKRNDIETKIDISGLVEDHID